MDNIKVKVSNQPKKRDTDAVSALEKHRRYVSEQPKAVPKSVDLLLKKQEKLCKEILYSDVQSNQNAPKFISGGNLPRH